MATVVADLGLPGDPGRAAAPQGDDARVDALARDWGVERQVADLRAALARQTDDE